MGKFQGKVAFITGSSKGIGKITAIELLKEGAKVVINGRNETALAAAEKELKTYSEHVLSFPGDVSESKKFTEAIKAIVSHFGKLDILILNAGLSSYGTVEKTGNETLENVMKVNTLGPFTGARIALPYIRESKGSIVFISSLAGLHGIPHSSVYSMSKMALTALAQSLKTELTGQGIHVGIIYVGFTKNDAEKTAIGPDGRIRPIQDRPGWIQQSPEKVARLILRHIRRRKFKSTFTAMGLFMAFMSRYFPRFFQFSMRGMLKNAAKLTAD